MGEAITNIDTGAASAALSPFAVSAQALFDAGYSPIPIMPRDKAPGEIKEGRWTTMTGWPAFAENRPDVATMQRWLAWSDAGVGVVTGSRVGEYVIVAIDFDEVDPARLDMLARSAPHSPMEKVGRRGFTRFYRASPDTRTQVYRIDGRVVLEILAGNKTRQTVMPPSIHPDTGRPYQWLGGGIVPAAQLPILTADDLEQLEDTLRACGWQQEKPHEHVVRQASAGDDDETVWQEANRVALGNLGAWVPHLGLLRLRKTAAGYEAVNEWRESGKGRPFNQRKFNLKFHPNGIKDMGTDVGYSPIDVVMHAHGREFPEAHSWLREKLGIAFDDSWIDDLIANMRNKNQMASNENLKLAAVDGVTVERSPLSPTPGNGAAPHPARPIIKATPYAWPECASIPPREWLYGNHYIRGFVSVTVAPGGVGKSSLVIADALAMAAGRELLSDMKSHAPLNVWLWNGEDPIDELNRRIAATAKHYGIRQDDCRGRLFVDSGRESKIVIAEMVKGSFGIVRPIVDAVKATIVENKIDVLIIDPFVKSHRVSENDNALIDAIASEWADIADHTGCAIELVHHSRKTGGGEVTLEDTRGASALISAARVARVLNGMTEDQAGEAGVENNRLFFRVDGGAKPNLAAPGRKARWYRMESVDLGNKAQGRESDSVGVVTDWRWPNASDGVTTDQVRAIQERLLPQTYREDQRSNDWAGRVVADVLGIDLDDKAAKKRAKALLDKWVRDGLLKVVVGLDTQRRERNFLAVGRSIDDPWPLSSEPVAEPAPVAPVGVEQT